MATRLLWAAQQKRFLKFYSVKKNWCKLRIASPLQHDRISINLNAKTMKNNFHGAEIDLGLFSGLKIQKNQAF